LNATVYSALTTTGSPGAQGSYYFRPIDTGASPFPYVFSNHAGLVVEPNPIYFDKLFQNPQINQTECLCNRSWAAAPPSLSTIWAHTPIILPNFIDTNIDLTTLVYSIDNDPSYTNTAHPTWLLSGENRPLASCPTPTAPRFTDRGRFRPAADEFLSRGAGKCFPLFQCVFSPLQIAKEALPQINAVLEIGLQAANHIHPSLAVLIRTIESALIFLPCRL
jgi:hypothetical protein